MWNLKFTEVKYWSGVRKCEVDFFIEGGIATVVFGPATNTLTSPPRGLRNLTQGLHNFLGYGLFVAIW